MSFCTVINCMDGRVQVPVVRYLQERAGVDYVDVITEPGPVAALARWEEDEILRSIRRRVDISREAHGSTTLAVVAHHDCAGNPVSDEEQLEQLRAAAGNLKRAYPDLEIIPLWVDAKWEVEESGDAGR